MDRNQRMRNHHIEISQTLNLAAEISMTSWAETASIDLKDNQIILSLGSRSSQPAIFVNNFSPTDKTIPTIDQAYTPSQTYRIQPGNRYSLSLIFPSLPLDQ